MSYSRLMDRRFDHMTAERVEIALLTRNAFDQQTALSFALLSGMEQSLVNDVLARPLTALRQQSLVYLKPTDRRNSPRY